MKVDARGLVCPQPIVLVKKALNKDVKELTVLVDNRAALENVTRFANAMKYNVSVEKNSDEFILTLRK